MQSKGKRGIVADSGQAEATVEREEVSKRQAWPTREIKAPCHEIALVEVGSVSELKLPWHLGLVRKA